LVQVYVRRRFIRIADNIGMENKLKPTTGEMISKLRSLGIENEIEFYFVPSQELINRIVRGGDPIIDQLPELAKKVFLGASKNQGHALHVPMVLKYIEGTLDARNSYIFDLGEIRVRNEHDLMIKCLNRSKNNTIKGVKYDILENELGKRKA